VYNVEEKKDQL